MTTRIEREAYRQAERLAWLINHKVTNPERVAERCHRLPAGHWHCRHGHLADCPDPTSCQAVDR